MSCPCQEGPSLPYADSANEERPAPHPRPTPGTVASPGKTAAQPPDAPRPQAVQCSCSASHVWDPHRISGTLVAILERQPQAGDPRLARCTCRHPWTTGFRSLQAPSVRGACPCLVCPLAPTADRQRQTWCMCEPVLG